jgi:HEAT repeat protein
MTSRQQFMPKSQPSIDELVKLLRSNASAKRRSAAKKLRKLQAEEAGPALLEALRAELDDPRTWETQYQMIMALGECKHIDSLEFLTNLADRDFSATMIYVAIGDATTRLRLLQADSIKSSIDIVQQSKNAMLIDGILRAIAMLRLELDDQSIETIIQYGNRLDINSHSRTWIAAAAPGWPIEKTKRFLEECLRSNNQQTQRAAEAALSKRYVKWSPL